MTTQILSVRWGLQILALIGLLIFATSIGSVPIRTSEIVAALSGCSLAHRAWITQVLFHVRLPRVLVAWLVGAALAQSGALLQTLFANPLAEPAVLGVSATAALFAVAAIYLGLTTHYPAVLPSAAFVGCCLATASLWVASRRFRGPHESILLLGVGLGQVGFALTSLLISLSLGNWEIAHQLMSWLLGSLEGRGWSHALWAVGPVAGAALWGSLRARDLDAMLLGETSASSLGVDVLQLRREIILVSSLLVGVTVAIGGVVGFVGLIVPHLIRRWVGPLHARLLTRSLLVGGAFLVVADLIARRLIAPEELRLGVVTALLGAPLFIAILIRSQVERVR